MGRQHASRSARSRRRLATVALIALGVAGAAGAFAISQRLDDERVVLEVEDAAAETPPTTIPTDATDRAAPESLLIGDLQLDGDVRSIGIEENGELEIPDESEIGWYQYGSTPGLPGATVLAAHVSWNGSLGPFHRLGDLEPGATVDVVLADKSVRTYQVVERTMYAKDELPNDRIWRTDGDETLVLVTCGGDFNRSERRYAHNIIVYAVPVAERTADEIAT